MSNLPYADICLVEVGAVNSILDRPAGPVWSQTLPFDFLDLLEQDFFFPNRTMTEVFFTPASNEAYRILNLGVISFPI